MADYPEGIGTYVVDIGIRPTRHFFGFEFVSDISETAYEKWENLLTLCYTEHATYKYQRKLTFSKPEGTGDVSINGKVMKLNLKIVSGETEDWLEGNLDFAVDNIEDDQVP